jgi:hypothetical protein
VSTVEIALTPVGKTLRPDRRLDVVFVHGLGDNDIDCWQQKNRPDTYWPTWLAADLPDIQVWMLRYGAAKFWFQSVAQALPDRAVSVLSFMVDHHLGDRDLVFVCHSLGGLVVKQLLQISEVRRDPRLKPIARATRGIAFLATPHSGSNIAVVAKLLGIASKATAGLTTDDPWLRLLSGWYRDNAAYLGWKTRAFHETLPTGPTLVVSHSSADPQVEGVICVGVDANHSDICKMSEPKGPVYEGVKALIRECLDTARPSRPESAPHFVDLSIANPPSAPANVLTYTATRSEGAPLIILPSLDYLDKLNASSMIHPIDYDWIPFTLSSPQLDIKMANHEQTPLLLTEAVFDVASSRPDLRPIPVLKREGHQMHLPLRNLGWGLVEDCRLIFDIIQDGQQIEAEHSLPFTQDLGTFEWFPEEAHLYEAFRARGVDVDGLRQMKFNSTTRPMHTKDREALAAMSDEDRAAFLRNLFGPFTSGGASVLGFIDYRWTDHDGVRHDERLPFSCRVLLTYPGPRRPLPPSFTYQVKLEVNRENYQVRLPLSQVIDPADSDRFLITVDAPRSSSHGFELSLSSNRGKIPCGGVVLNYFRPRNEKEFFDPKPSS